MSDWDPAQYRRFAAERAQPFWDLVGVIAGCGFDRAVDLGCGSGELTSAVAARLDVGSMTGVDNSPAMLAEAGRWSAATTTTTTVRFVEGDIARWTSDADHDLVIANASLQWVPHHDAVLARWAKALRPGGQLAVQVPANADHASHLAAADVARREPFRSAFGAAGPPPDPVAEYVLRPEQYAELLFGLGVAEPHVRLQVYPHVLASTDDVVEWTKGTTLTRFFARLPGDLHDPFVDAYRTELRARVGDRAPYFYAFKRILMWGRLGDGRAGSR